MASLTCYEKLLHDLMNSLTTIVAQCEMMELRKESTDRSQRIRESALIMAGLIRAHQVSLQGDSSSTKEI